MHNLFKKYALGIGLALGVALPALAANIPLLPSPSQYAEPNQIVPTINTVIQSMNGAVPGVITSLPAPFTTTGTGANNILVTQVILAVGQTVHCHANGVNSADANVKTMTFNYGSGPTSAAVVVTGSGANWFVDFHVTNVGVPASKKAQLEGVGAQAATAITVALR